MPKFSSTMQIFLPQLQWLVLLKLKGCEVWKIWRMWNSKIWIGPNSFQRSPKIPRSASNCIKLPLQELWFDTTALTNTPIRLFRPHWMTIFWSLFQWWFYQYEWICVKMIFAQVQSFKETLSETILGDGEFRLVMICCILCTKLPNLMS